jgi:hypothetical protein
MSLLNIIMYFKLKSGVQILFPVNFTVFKFPKMEHTVHHGTYIEI